ncbi:hypothetical protein LZP85_14475 [Priestia flexa]|uniref:hypothetical protein n=1 Tax=Priestia flexa TaxID=86664 RepID=UPI001A8C5285|nr:hypothetical protein [Priestia flexa]MBN8432923.1 hypothetical protein [Priestia flexa]MCA0965091.1 hypothetical protein [Priestia flexa]UIR29166.1 hypothetical protein LZP85_14475 [Priestia flexa]UZW67579.1 hypothetical protein OC195_08615 [Priestia flexa]
MRKWLLFVIGWVCSYYFITTSVFEQEGASLDTIVFFLENPENLFATVLLFLISCTCQAIWVQVLIENVYRWIQGTRLHRVEFLVALLSLVGCVAFISFEYYVLLPVILVSFIYGIGAASQSK